MVSVRVGSLILGRSGASKSLIADYAGCGNVDSASMKHSIAPIYLRGGSPPARNSYVSVSLSPHADVGFWHNQPSWAPGREGISVTRHALKYRRIREYISSKLVSTVPARSGSSSSQEIGPRCCGLYFRRARRAATSHSNEFDLFARPAESFAGCSPAPRGYIRENPTCKIGLPQMRENPGFGPGRWRYRKIWKWDAARAGPIL